MKIAILGLIVLLSLSAINANFLSFRLDDFRNTPAQQATASAYAMSNLTFVIGLYADQITPESRAFLIHVFSSNAEVEVAVHGLSNVNLNNFNQDDQFNYISQAKDQILNTFPFIRVTTFAPLGDFNADTVAAAVRAGFTAFSSTTQRDSPPFAADGIDHFPSAVDSSAFGSDDLANKQLVDSHFASNGFLIVRVVSLNPDEYILSNETGEVNNLAARRRKWKWFSEKEEDFYRGLKWLFSCDGIGRFPCWVKRGCPGLAQRSAEELNVNERDVTYNTPSSGEYCPARIRDGPCLNGGRGCDDEDYPSAMKRGIEGDYQPNGRPASKSFNFNDLTIKNKMPVN